MWCALRTINPTKETNRSMDEILNVYVPTNIVLKMIVLILMSCVSVVNMSIEL